MKTSFLFIFSFIALLFCFFITSPARAVEPVKLFQKPDPLDSSVDLLFSKETDFEKRLNWRERIALKILKKKLKKRLKKGSRNVASPVPQADDEGCVTLILKNGQRFRVEIVRMDKTEVVCRNCGNKNGQEITIPWEKVQEVEGDWESAVLADRANGYRMGEDVPEEAFDKNPENENVSKFTSPDYSDYDECAWMRFTNNKRKKVRIIATTDTTFVYKDCNEKNAAEITVQKADVNQIWTKDQEFRFVNPNLEDTEKALRVEGVGVAAGLISAIGVLILLYTFNPIAILFLILGTLLGLWGAIRYFLNLEKYNSVGLLFAVLALLIGFMGTQLILNFSL